MKAINKDLGFWLLLFMTLGAHYQGQIIASSIYLTGAILFNAIKSQDKPS